MARRILVTGASGFLGRHFCDFLAARSIEVHTLSRTGIAGLQNHRAASNSVEELSQILELVKPDGVLHLAGTGSGGFANCMRVNALYAATLLDAMQGVGLADCPVLLIGSAAELGELTTVPASESALTQPTTAYGASKLAQTELGLAAARRGRPVLVLRLSNLLGAGLPGTLGPARFVTQLAAIRRTGHAGGSVSTGPLHMIRDYIDVEDVCRLAWNLFELPSARNRLVNVCSGIGVKTGELLDQLVRLSGLRVEIQPEASVPAGVPVHIGSTTLLEELTGPLRLVPLEESLLRLWNAALL